MNTKRAREEVIPVDPKPFSHDLIVIRTTPAVIDFNFEFLRNSLATELQKYDIVVTADTVADAKKLATELNKTAGVIDQKRKEVVAQESAPVREFEERMKELTAMCKDGRTKILNQVAKFEAVTLAKARELLANQRAEFWIDKGVEPEFRKAEIDDLVLLTSVTAKGSLAAAPRLKLEARVRADLDKQAMVARRLLELENASYRARLSAPLTRDHVRSFLFAEDAVYNVELQRIIDVEVTRQEATEKRLREQMESEQRQKEERLKEEAARKARMEQAAAAAPVVAPAPEVKPPQEANPPITAAAAPIPTTPAPRPAPTTEPPQVMSSRPLLIIEAIFQIPAPLGVPNAVIETKFRKKLTEAGITSLKEIHVHRA